MAPIWKGAEWAEKLNLPNAHSCATLAREDSSLGLPTEHE